MCPGLDGLVVIKEKEARQKGEFERCNLFIPQKSSVEEYCCDQDILYFVLGHKESCHLAMDVTTHHFLL